MALFKKLLKALKKGFKVFSAKKPSRPKKVSSKRKVIRRSSVRARSVARSGKRTAKTRTLKKKLRGVIKRASIPSKASFEASEASMDIGVVTHYFSKIEVCVVKIEKGKLSVGDKIFIQGPSTKFKQDVLSLQIENSDVRFAQKGQLVGMKVLKKTKEGDRVLKIL